MYATSMPTSGIHENRKATWKHNARHTALEMRVQHAHMGTYRIRAGFRDELEQRRAEEVEGPHPLQSQTNNNNNSNSHDQHAAALAKVKQRRQHHTPFSSEFRLLLREKAS